MSFKHDDDSNIEIEKVEDVGDVFKEWFEVAKSLSKKSVRIIWNDDIYALDFFIQNINDGFVSEDNIDSICAEIEEWLSGAEQVEQAEQSELQMLQRIKEPVRLLPDNDNITLEMLVSTVEKKES